MKAVRYHLEGGTFTRAILIGRIPGFSETDKTRQLIVDLSTPEGQGVVGVFGWFADDYVRAWHGLVPEAAEQGTEPGEWSDYPQQQGSEVQP